MKIGNVSPASYWNAHLGTTHGDKIEEFLLYFHENALTLHEPLPDIKARVEALHAALDCPCDRVVVIASECVDASPWAYEGLLNGTPIHDAIWDYNNIPGRDDWKDVQEGNCKLISETLDEELLVAVWGEFLLNVQKPLYPKCLADEWLDALYANFATLVLLQVAALANGDDEHARVNNLLIDLWKAGNVPMGVIASGVAVALTA